MTNQEIVKIDSFKNDLISKHGRELNTYFGGNKEQMQKYMGAVKHCITKIPSLLNDIPSLTNAVIDLAKTGLSPGLTQEAYIIPYKNRATAMISYQGYAKLLYQSGIKNIVAEIVRENDDFKMEHGNNPKITHNIDPRKSKKQRGAAIGCYVSAGGVFKYMHRDDILEFRDKFSQSYKDPKKRKYSPREEENDPDLNMWKKTVFKQLIKLLPKNEIIGVALELDNQEAPVHGNINGNVGGESDHSKALEEMQKY